MLETRQKAARQMDHEGKGERRNAEYPARMPALRAGDVMASLLRGRPGFFPGMSAKVVPQGDEALSFEEDGGYFF